MNIAIALCLAALFPACRAQYDFSLNNTLAIFLLHNEKGYYFCLPIQYMGDYQINDFVFANGYIMIGDYEVPLKREGIKISIYINESADSEGSSVEGFNLIHSEENGNISISTMSEPLAVNHESDEKYNHYYIFVEKYLLNDDMKGIIRQFGGNKIFSKFAINFDITIDNELQAGSGLLDDFELYNGLAIDPAYFPVNLNFFKARYFQK
jgi:hypothetical protein